MFNLTSSSNFSYPKNINRKNEDFKLIPKKIGNGYLCAVADGVGSYKGAEKASKLVVEYLESLSEDNLLDIDATFKELKIKISHLGNDTELSKAATTLTYAYLHEKGLYIGHVGDCRLYVREGKKLIQLTKDHTQYQKLLDEKLYTKKELKEINGKNILISAISKYIDMAFDNIFIPLADLPIINDKLSLFIMSDGAHSFWETSPRFSEKTMSNVVKFSNSLLRRIEKKSPIDDYTLVSAEFEVI